MVSPRGNAGATTVREVVPVVRQSRQEGTVVVVVVEGVTVVIKKTKHWQNMCYG